MNKEILMFGDVEMEKRKLHYSKCPTDLSNKILIK